MSATACTAPGLECANPLHDHTPSQDDDRTPEGAMRCADCGAPTHYDEGIGDYLHDAPDAPECFLIRDASPMAEV